MHLPIHQECLVEQKYFSLFPRFIYSFGVLRRFQHCTGHITTDSWKGRGNQYLQFVRFLYCKLPTNGKQLPAFPLEAVPGIEPRPQRWEARVLPLFHRGPLLFPRNSTRFFYLKRSNDSIMEYFKTAMKKNAKQKRYKPEYNICPV